MARHTFAFALLALLALVPGALSHAETPLELLQSYNATEYVEVFENFAPNIPVNSTDYPLTLFIAKDDAIASFGEEHPDAVTVLSGPDAAEIFALVANVSVVNGTYETLDLFDGPITTWGGEQLEAFRDGPSGFIHISSPSGVVAHVVESNVWGGWGIIHFLDTPIFPNLDKFNLTSEVLGSEM